MTAPVIVEQVEAWALVPESDPMRFERVDGRYPMRRWLKPFVADLRWKPFGDGPKWEEPRTDFVVLVSRTYALRALGWIDIVFVADTERGLLEDRLLAAGGALLFCMWLFGEHAKRSRVTRSSEIERVKAAVQRYQAERDAIRQAIDDDGGPQSAHEHDPTWKALADRQDRAERWLQVLLLKRGTDDDLALVEAIRIGAWP